MVSSEGVMGKGPERVPGEEWYGYQSSLSKGWVFEFLYSSGPGWELRLGQWQDVLADVEADALIVDAPYSNRTHSAYREMPELRRAAIEYHAMDAIDVLDFVASWSLRIAGWFVSLTDHVLAPHWSGSLAINRYVFSPLSCVEPGRSVRLSGDGPAQWSVSAVVARPRSVAYARWGALPGAYVVPQGVGRPRDGKMTGGKPLWLMRALVRDYSRPGDLIVDPCAGAGTTLLAAVIEGRSSIGAEMNPETFELAVSRLRRGYTPTFPEMIQETADGEDEEEVRDNEKEVSKKTKPATRELPGSGDW